MNDLERLNLATDLRRLSYWWLEDNKAMIKIFWPRVKPLLIKISQGTGAKLAKEILEEKGDRQQMAERLMTLSVIETLK